MNSPRRFLTFSLRTIFVLLTLFAVWLGFVVRRAHKQRDAVHAIEALGGAAIYDWQQDPPAGVFTAYPPPVAGQPPGPAWLRRMVGDDFFQNVSGVDFGSPIAPTRIELSKAIPYLSRLPTLQRIRVFAANDSQSQDELAAALPHCELQLFYVDDSPSPRIIQMDNR